MREVPDWQVTLIVALMATGVTLPVARWLGFGRDPALATSLVLGALAALAWIGVLRWNERDWQRSIEQSEQERAASDEGQSLSEREAIQ